MFAVIDISLKVNRVNSLYDDVLKLYIQIQWYHIIKSDRNKLAKYFFFQNLDFFFYKCCLRSIIHLQVKHCGQLGDVNIFKTTLLKIRKTLRQVLIIFCWSLTRSRCEYKNVYSWRVLRSSHDLVDHLSTEGTQFQPSRSRIHSVNRFLMINSVPYSDSFKG